MHLNHNEVLQEPSETRGPQEIVIEAIKQVTSFQNHPLHPFLISFLFFLESQVTYILLIHTAFNLLINS